MELAMVWWLVITQPGSYATIVPIPYRNEELCNKAAESVYMAECVPQPINDVLRFGYAHHGYNYYDDVMAGE